jgi:hypothetical protein
MHAGLRLAALVSLSKEYVAKKGPSALNAGQTDSKVAPGEKKCDMKVALARRKAQCHREIERAQKRAPSGCPER